LKRKIAYYFMKKIIIIIFLIVSNQVYSQEKHDKINPRTDDPFGLNFNIGGPSILGLSTNYYINPKTSFEAGIGLYGVFGGGTYHFNESNNKKLTNYFGVFAHHLFDIGFIDEDSNSAEDDIRNGIYFPFGIQYLDFNDISVRFEIATGTIIKLFFGIQFGYHF
jgi:hypothetical protein